MQDMLQKRKKAEAEELKRKEEEEAASEPPQSPTVNDRNPAWPLLPKLVELW